MNILLSNDDGIFSEGLKSLANVLKKQHNITIIAPNGNRSGFSRSLSFHKDILVEKVEFDGLEAYSLSGTPGDCAKFGISHLKKDIDLFICGINLGPNLGNDIFYSGTVNACFEANFLGVPAIAFSNSAHKEYLLQENAIFIDKILDKLISLSSNEYTLNVNLPNILSKDIKGIKMCPSGSCRYTDGYVSPSENVYRLIGEPIPPTKEDEGTDVHFVHQGYVTVTPVTHSVMNNLAYEKLKGNF